MNHRDYVMRYISNICDLLHFQYGSPNHNNKKNVLDEVIFILLSRRTRDSDYEEVYDKLKRSFPRWKDVVRTSDEELLKVIGKAGLGFKRVQEIKDILQKVRNDFGRYSLERLRKWNNSRVFRYLIALRGIGPKSAYCVMMYSLNRKVFPADTHVIRICTRLGIISGELNHKEAQEQLADIFPKKLRYSIHVNMVSHGRDICKSLNPFCSECIISGFCARNRKKSAIDGKPGFIDLFAGPGGMSIGFEHAGFILQGAIESDRHASATYLNNRPTFPSEMIVDTPIENVSPSEFKPLKPEVIVAGPPCQEFSHVRQNSRKNLGRRELYWEVLKFVKELKPIFVVIENVPGMTFTGNHRYVKKVESGLKEIGYEIKRNFLDAKDYGIPQSRKRLFFIARKVHMRDRKEARAILERIWNRIKLWKNKKRISFLDGISGLPTLKAGEGADLMKNQVPGRRSRYVEELGPNAKIIFNHIARKHNPRDLRAYRIMNDGDNAIDLYKKDSRLMLYSTSNFPTKFFKIRRDRPSPTIVAHLRRDANSFIHPIDNRGISPREAARLQSFPDSYRFLGSFGVQFEQIGNAVPPRLAEYIALSILMEIKKNKRR